MEWFSEKIIKKQKEKGTGKTDQTSDGIHSLTCLIIY